MKLIKIIFFVIMKNLINIYKEKIIEKVNIVYKQLYIKSDEEYSLFFNKLKKIFII